MAEPGHVERLVTRDVEDQVGKPLSQRARQAQRSIEAYLASGVRPRWMERLVDVEAGAKRAARVLGREHEALRARLPAAEFEARWREVAADAPRRFAEHNELVAQHNAWYPIERDLPMDPRTQDYVLVQGRSFRREPITEAWVLERFPAG